MITPANADVIVVGGGNAALVAALTAREQGARVVVLEAAPEKERGGNSRFSGAIFRFVHDGMTDLLPLVTEKSRRWSDRITVDAYPSGRYLDDLDRSSAGRTDSALSVELVHRSFETVRWMAEQGVRWEFTVGKLLSPDSFDADEEYALPPGGAVRAAGEGLGLMKDLYRIAEERGIEIHYESPVVDITIEGSRCEGVVVRQGDRTTVMRGNVILAAGGFEANPEMRQRWLGPGWDLVKVRGTRFNTGMVLAAALRAGAQPAGHWGGCHAVPLDAGAPDVGDLRITDKMSRYSYAYGLLINRDGQRFVDEGEDEVWLTYAKTGAAIRAQPRGWAFQLFDAKTVHLLEPRYSTGTPVAADTLDELARALGVDPDAMAETVEVFNDSCTRDGGFDPFHLDGVSAQPDGQPSKSNWALPLDSPPFVAYPVTCGITFTYGGLKIDEEARVYDIAGRPIRGLFATGELTGGFFYHNYPAGAGLMRGAVYGRIAGSAAAAEPWAED